MVARKAALGPLVPWEGTAPDGPREGAYACLVEEEVGSDAGLAKEEVGRRGNPVGLEAVMGIRFWEGSGWKRYKSRHGTISEVCFLGRPPH